jgi:Outer membrane protein beta-barrel domain
MRLGLVTLTLLLAAMPIAAADDLNVEITPFVSYRFGGTFDVEGSTDSYEIEDSEAVGLLFNLRHSGNTQWEVLYSLQQSTARLRGSTLTAPAVDTDIHVLQFGGTYQGDGDKFRPYVALTLGGTHIKTRANGSQSDSFFSGSIGVGLNLIPNNRLGIRLEARAYGTLMNSSTGLFCQTGPNNNVCAVRIDGSLLGQFEAIAGFVFRF